MVWRKVRMIWSPWGLSGWWSSGVPCSSEGLWAELLLLWGVNWSLLRVTSFSVRRWGLCFQTGAHGRRDSWHPGCGGGPGGRWALGHSLWTCCCWSSGWCQGVSLSLAAGLNWPLCCWGRWWKLSLSLFWVTVTLSPAGDEPRQLSRL